MNYWLIKSEPSVFSWKDLELRGVTAWDGVRNYAARNHLRSMKKGDCALFYHSNEGLCIVGVAEIIREHYPDPTAKEGDWSAVDIRPVLKLSRSVGLSELKKDKILRKMKFVLIPRLSVSPVTRVEFKRVVELSETPLDGQTAG